MVFILNDATGWSPLDSDVPGNPALLAVESACCHIVCSVESVQSLERDHNLITAQIVEGYVKSNYWTGKQFICLNDAPPYLTFLGSQEFGVCILILVLFKILLLNFYYL